MLRLLHSKKLIKVVRFLFWAIIVILVMLGFYFPNYTKLKLLRKENKLLLEKIYALRDEISELNRNLQKIDADPFLWEKLARQHIGVVKEDEIVIDINKKE